MAERTTNAVAFEPIIHVLVILQTDQQLDQGIGCALSVQQLKYDAIAFRFGVLDGAFRAGAGAGGVGAGAGGGGVGVEGAGQLEVFGVLGGDARKVIGRRSRVEHARVAVCIWVVRVAVVLELENWLG